MAATGPARRYVILITGASRGFGKSLAVACAKEWSPTTALDMVRAHNRTQQSLWIEPGIINDHMQSIPAFDRKE